MTVYIIKLVQLEKPKLKKKSCSKCQSKLNDKLIIALTSAAPIQTTEHLFNSQNRYFKPVQGQFLGKWCLNLNSSTLLRLKLVTL